MEIRKKFNSKMGAQLICELSLKAQEIANCELFGAMYNELFGVLYQELAFRFAVRIDINLNKRIKNDNT